MHADAQQLSSWSATAGGWLRGTGTRTLWVGSSSRDPAQRTTVTLNCRKGSARPG
jgi:beta-glucosidase